MPPFALDMAAEEPPAMPGRTASPPPAEAPVHYQQPAPVPLANLHPAHRSLLESLDAQERLMDSRVLHVNTLASASSGPMDADGKQERFRKTVMAAHEIVTQKLYKARAASLEAYFKSVWKISRAQVYRFLDCATVLTHLEDFPHVPSHERLCRSLKRFAFSNAGATPGTARPASPEAEAQGVADLRTLWSRVLEKSQGNNELITSTFVGRVWDELVRQGAVSRANPVTGTGEGPKAVRRGGGKRAGRPKKKGGRRRSSDDDSDEDEEDYPDDEDEDPEGEELPFGMDDARRTPQPPRARRTAAPRAAARRGNKGVAPGSSLARQVMSMSPVQPHDSDPSEEPEMGPEDDESGSDSDGGRRRSGESQIGSMERESWAALMARSGALQTRRSDAAIEAEEEEQRGGRTSGPFYPPQQQQVPSGVVRSASYGASSFGKRGYGQQQHKQVTQFSGVVKIGRPSSADPEADYRMRYGSYGPTSFSSDGTRFGQQQQPRYGSSPNMAGSWPTNPDGLAQRAARQSQQGGAPLPYYGQQQPQQAGFSPTMYPQLPVPSLGPKAMALPYPHFPLPHPTPSPGPSEDDPNASPAGGQLEEDFRGSGSNLAPRQQRREKSRSPNLPQLPDPVFAHQPVPRRHAGHAYHPYANPHKPESPRLTPRFPSPSPMSPALHASASRLASLPHIPDLNLGPPPQVPTPAASDSSPHPRPREDHMTLDDLASVALMRRMSVKGISEGDVAEVGPAPMEEDEGRDSRGALGFILN